MNYDLKQREDLEEIILGTLLSYDKNLVMRDLFFKHGFKKKDFFITKIYQDIYVAILECWSLEIPADPVTVYNNRAIEYRGIDNDEKAKLYYTHIIICVQKMYAESQIEHHLWILKQYVLIDYWNGKANDILNGYWDLRDVLTVSSNIIESYNLLEESITAKFKEDNDLSDLEAQAQKKYDQVQKGETVGIPTTIQNIDNHTNGLHAPEFTIIGGRPGMGKSTVALIIGSYMSYRVGKEGVFFSLEMSKLQLYNRLVAHRTGISYEKIKNYNLSKEEWDIVKLEYKKLDADKLTIISGVDYLDDIIAKIEELDPDFVIIDYIQLVKFKGKIKRNTINREQELGEVSKTFKQVALNRDIPVIALAQLSRAVEKRPNKRPLLSDLRESGSLEQDADNVWFCYREAYYKEQENLIFPEIEKGNLELIIAKAREGSTAIIKLHIVFETFDIENDFKSNNDIINDSFM